MKLYEEDYEGLLIELISRTTETVLILDALDECVGEDTRSSNEIGKVLKTLNRLLGTDLPIKIVVASRYENRIMHNFTGKHTIEISADDNSSDIEKMVVARIDDYNLTDPKVRIPRDLEQKILKVFNEKSQGKYVILPFVNLNLGDAETVQISMGYVAHRSSIMWTYRWSPPGSFCG